MLIVSQRFRDAGRNVADCLEKLRELLVEAASPPRPRRADAADAIVRAASHRKQAAALAEEAAPRFDRQGRFVTSPGEEQ